MSAGRANLSRRTILRLLGAGLAAGGASRAHAFEAVARDDLISLFIAAGVTGCFAVFDASRERITLVNGPRAHRRFPPGHTFQIVENLIAAEIGVIKFDRAALRSNNHVISNRFEFTHVGTIEDIGDSLSFIINKSKYIGMNKYSEWLNRLDYGNASVGDDIEKLRKDGSLQISAVEQVKFLGKLGLGKLPASWDAQAVIRDRNRVEKKGDAFLYAKQGGVFSRDQNIRWWVGWVERGDDVAAFALNYDVPEKGRNDMHISLGRAFLTSLGLY